MFRYFPIALMRLTCNALKGHWQQKISIFYIKVFDLSKQSIAVWCYETLATHFKSRTNNDRDVMCW